MALKIGLDEVFKMAPDKVRKASALYLATELKFY